MADSLKKVEILNDSNEWNSIPFMELKKGAIFRIFNNDGQMIGDKNGNPIFIAEEDAFVHDGKNTIKYESYSGDRLGVKKDDETEKGS